MPAFESLPPDQRAVLQLVLSQGRSYEDLSTVLHLEPEAVATRARVGAEALAPAGAAALDEDDRGLVVDYLLGQQGVAARRITRRALAESAPLNAWARELAAQLEPHAGEGGLPEVPALEPGAEAEPEPAAVTEPEPVVAAAAPGAGGEGEEPDTVLEPDEEEAPRRSLLGGALLLAGLAILIVVLVVALLHNDSSSGDGSGSSSPPPADTQVASTSTATTTTAAEIQTLGQANLAPTQAGSPALAVAKLEVQGNQAGFDITAQGLQTVANTYHAVWLQSADGKKIQFLGAVLNQDVSNGRFRRVARVPSNITAFNRMIISREPITSSKATPAAPTTIVLSGPLKLVGTQ